MIVSARSAGAKRPLFADWAVPPPARPEQGDGGLTLRELIGHVVRAEVEAFRSRQEARRLDRVLTARQIEEGVARGRVAPEGRGIVQKVDEEDAVGAALQAFEDGLYLVVIDGREHRELDAQVFLTPDSRVTFIRLMFLAGA
jgi:hypothetical protein